MSNFTTVITICDRPHIGGGASKIAIETAAALARIGVNSYFFSALGDPDPSLIESGVVCVNCGQNDVLNGGVSGAAQGIWNRRSETALDDLLKQLDPKVVATRPLAAVLYATGELVGAEFETQADVLRGLGKLGFPTAKLWWECRGIEEVIVRAEEFVLRGIVGDRFLRAGFSALSAPQMEQICAVIDSVRPGK